MKTNNQNNDFLRKVAEQCTAKITRAIIERIENGAKIERSFGGVSVDGLFIVKGNKKEGIRPAVVFRLDTPEIYALFEPTADQLQDRIKELREKLQEMENKLNTLKQ